MKRLGLATCLLTVFGILASSQPAQGASGPGGFGGNGQPTRPFYIFAHNPNALSETNEALSHGANALEPDLMRFSDNAFCCYPAVPGSPIALNPLAGPSGLFVYHDHVLVTTRMPATLEAYLQDVHSQIKDLQRNVALIVFDIKTQAASYLKGSVAKAETLRKAVRDNLNYDGVNVYVIYSVATTADAAGFFDYMCLEPREGLMIDSDNHPDTIFNTLASHIENAQGHCGNPEPPLPYNIGYGNGSFGESYGLAPNVMPSMFYAAWMRAAHPVWLAIPYAYPIQAESRMIQYISAGVDGLIPDYDIQPQIWSLTINRIDALRGIVLNHPDIYPATVGDNPFTPRKEAYGLEVHTRDVWLAGTTGHLTFKLTGSCGTAQVTIDANYQKLFGRGETNYVTIPSKSLGPLQKLELFSDEGCGLANSKAWSPGSVRISSDGWGIPDADNHRVDFSGANVCSGHPASRPLPGWGLACVHNDGADGGE